MGIVFDDRLIFVIMLFVIFIGLGVAASLIRDIFEYLNKKIEVKNKELENAKYSMMLSLKPKEAQEAIEQYVERYFGKYTLLHFAAPDVNYIKKEDADECIREVTKTIMLEISETYIFYFKILYNIENEDDLLKKINELVTEYMLSYLVEFNKPKE